MTMLQSLAWVFAVGFIGIGFLGFVPALAPDGALFGLFDVDGVHNGVHMATGIVALLAAAAMASWPRIYFQWFGIIYALVTVVGFAADDNVLGLFAVNVADNILHLVVALMALYAGFGAPEEKEEWAREHEHKTA